MSLTLLLGCRALIYMSIYIAWHIGTSVCHLLLCLTYFPILRGLTESSTFIIIPISNPLSVQKENNFTNEPNGIVIISPYFVTTFTAITTIALYFIEIFVYNSLESIFMKCWEGWHSFYLSISVEVHEYSSKCLFGNFIADREWDIISSMLKLPNLIKIFPTLCHPLIAFNLFVLS